MFLSRALQISDRDIANFAWSSLKKFNHVPSTTDRLMQVHRALDKQRRNVTKQATQIRYCLNQAREYRDASMSVSLATRPVLMYYSIMNLALAQILFNGNGDSSLDRARGEHAHHGFLFTAGVPPKGNHDLVAHANLLRARPMIDDNGHRRGTFELWCRQSQEDPLAGNHLQADGILHRSGLDLLMTSTDRHFARLDNRGISLLECFEALPMLRTNIYHSSKTIRAKISRTSKGLEHVLQLVIHPHYPKADVEALADQFKFSANFVSHIDAFESDHGLMFNLREHELGTGHIYFPPACTWSSDEIRFLPPTRTLNEFAYIYLALFILGNYARYFPERWMADVEEGSALSLLSEHLLFHADNRMSLLTLSDLSGDLYVLQRE